MAVIPVYNTLALPDANIYFKTDYYKSMTNKEPSMNERVILAVLKENQSREEITEKSFYPIGVSGLISEINSNGINDFAVS